MSAISDRACRYVGVDLHKQTITIAVVDGTRKLVSRKRFSNLQTDAIIAYLKSFMPFELVVEATAGWPRLLATFGGRRPWRLYHEQLTPPS